MLFTVHPSRPTYAGDARLSHRARGVLTFLLHYPAKPGKKAAVQAIIDGGTEGRDAVYKAIDELIGLGYATRRKERSKKGRIRSVHLDIYDHPRKQADLPLPENPDVDSGPLPENPDVDRWAKNAEKHPLPENPEVVNQPVYPLPENPEATNNVCLFDLSSKNNQLNETVVIRPDLTPAKVAEMLAGRGVITPVARELVREHGPAVCLLQIAHLDYLLHRSQTEAKPIGNPGGKLRAMITYDYHLPKPALEKFYARFTVDANPAPIRPLIMRPQVRPQLIHEEPQPDRSTGKLDARALQDLLTQALPGYKGIGSQPIPPTPNEGENENG